MEAIQWASPAMLSDMFMQRVDEIGTWVVDRMGQLRNSHSADAIESTLACDYYYYKMLCGHDDCFLMRSSLLGSMFGKL